MGQVLLVLRAKGPYDAEIDRGVFRPFRVGHDDEYVPRVHVGVEEVVTKHLCEEDFDAVFRQHFYVGARLAQGIHVADRNSVNTLLDHDLRAAVIPVDVRDVQHVRVCKIPLELGGVRGFSHQVEFVDDGLLVLRDNLERLQPFAVLPVAFCEPRQHP